jgi:hypothetical protein
MRAMAPRSAELLLWATALFFLGPQFGSLDIDDDGVPDVPVMAVLASDQNVQTLPSDCRTNQRRTCVGFLATCNDLALVKEVVAVEPHGVRLHSIVSLRC